MKAVTHPRAQSNCSSARAERTSWRHH